MPRTAPLGADTKIEALLGTHDSAHADDCASWVFVSTNVTSSIIGVSATQLQKRTLAQPVGGLLVTMKVKARSGGGWGQTTAEVNVSVILQAEAVSSQ